MWFNKERRLAYLEQHRKKQAANEQEESTPFEPDQLNEAKSDAAQPSAENASCEPNAETRATETTSTTDTASADKPEVDMVKKPELSEVKTVQNDGVGLTS